MSKMKQRSPDMPKENVGLFRCMFCMIGWNFLWLGLLRISNDIASLSGPFLLGKILHCFASDAPDILVWCGLFVTSQVVKVGKMLLLESEIL